MQVIGMNVIHAYLQRKPGKDSSVLAFLALVSAANWRCLEDIESQYPGALLSASPEKVVFEFKDENVRIEMRVNCAIGLVRILKIGRSPNEKRSSQ